MASEQETTEKNVSKRRWAISVALALGVLTCSVLIQISAAAQKPMSDYSNLAQPNQSELSKPNISTAETQKARTGKAETTIVPKINVSTRRAWADGETPVVITISLEAVKGNQPRTYRPGKEITFNLEARNAMLTPSQIRILAGEKDSESAILTAKQPTTVEVRCTPDGEYKGLAITRAQSEQVEFIAPIDRVGIEPLSGTASMNLPILFEVYLYNHSDTNTKLPPAGPVFVHLDSENGRGRVVESDVQLTNQEFSKRVHYVGRIWGTDNITALAHYENRRLDAKSERKIVFPWKILLAGIIGTVIGSIVRSLRRHRRRLVRFLESFFSGLAFCLFVIVYPIGTRFPELGSYMQPSLILGLAILTTVSGGAIVKRLTRERLEDNA